MTINKSPTQQSDDNQKILEPGEIVTENCITTGRELSYVSRDSLLHVVEKNNGRYNNVIQKWLCDVFLPYGYPDSVSKDYWRYQVWDTAQAFCSTITGTLTTQAILKGVGVGDSSATVLGAAITWILKDGAGMVGRILFTYWKGRSLDADCKQWRFFADILNDIAIFFEFLLPAFYKISIYVLCVTSVMKSIVGVAGGATRAAITQHQALANNMGDVAAKDGSQETCVNLIASIFGIFLLTILDNNNEATWFVFCVMTFFHIVSNYYAINALIFDHLNESRLILVLKTYLHFDTVAPPGLINQKEPLLLNKVPNAKKFCGYDIKIGYSIKETIDPNMSPRDLQDLISLFEKRKYFIVPDLKKHVMYIYIEKECNATEIVSAYFHGVILGIALCNYNNVLLNFSTKRRHLHHKMPLDRMEHLMKSFQKNESATAFIFPQEKFALFNDFITNEMLNFFTALSVNGWNLSTQSLPIGEYRISIQRGTKKDD